MPYFKPIPSLSFPQKDCIYFSPVIFWLLGTATSACRDCAFELSDYIILSFGKKPTGLSNIALNGLGFKYLLSVMLLTSSSDWSYIDCSWEEWEAVASLLRVLTHVTFPLNGGVC